MELIRGFRPDTEVECAFMREKLRLMRNPPAKYFREKRLGEEVIKKSYGQRRQEAILAAARQARLDMIKEIEDYTQMPLEKVLKMVRAWRDPKQLVSVHGR